MIIPEKHTTEEAMTIVYLVNVQILLQGNERQSGKERWISWDAIWEENPDYWSI